MTKKQMRFSSRVSVFMDKNTTNDEQ